MLEDWYVGNKLMLSLIDLNILNGVINVKDLVSQNKVRRQDRVVFCRPELLMLTQRSFLNIAPAVLLSVKKIFFFGP